MARGGSATKPKSHPKQNRKSVPDSFPEWADPRPRLAKRQSSKPPVASAVRPDKKTRASGANNDDKNSNNSAQDRDRKHRQSSLTQIGFKVERMPASSTVQDSEYESDFELGDHPADEDRTESETEAETDIGIGETGTSSSEDLSSDDLPCELSVPAGKTDRRARSAVRGGSAQRKGRVRDSLARSQDLSALLADEEYDSVSDEIETESEADLGRLSLSRPERDICQDSDDDKDESGARNYDDDDDHDDDKNEYDDALFTGQQYRSGQRGKPRRPQPLSPMPSQPAYLRETVSDLGVCKREMPDFEMDDLSSSQPSAVSALPFDPGADNWPGKRRRKSEPPERERQRQLEQQRWAQQRHHSLDGQPLQLELVSQRPPSSPLGRGVSVKDEHGSGGDRDAEREEEQCSNVDYEKLYAAQRARLQIRRSGGRVPGRKVRWMSSQLTETQASRDRGRDRDRDGDQKGGVMGKGVAYRSPSPVAIPSTLLSKDASADEGSDTEVEMDAGLHDALGSSPSPALPLRLPVPLPPPPPSLPSSSFWNKSGTKQKANRSQRGRSSLVTVKQEFKRPSPGVSTRGKRAVGRDDRQGTLTQLKWPLGRTLAPAIKREEDDILLFESDDESGNSSNFDRRAPLSSTTPAEVAIEGTGAVGDGQVTVIPDSQVSIDVDMIPETQLDDFLVVKDSYEGEEEGELGGTNDEKGQDGDLLSSVPDLTLDPSPDGGLDGNDGNGGNRQIRDLDYDCLDKGEVGDRDGLDLGATGDSLEKVIQVLDSQSQSQSQLQSQLQILFEESILNSPRVKSRATESSSKQPLQPLQGESQSWKLEKVSPSPYSNTHSPPIQITTGQLPTSQISLRALPSFQPGQAVNEAVEATVSNSTKRDNVDDSQDLDEIAYKADRDCVPDSVSTATLPHPSQLRALPTGDQTGPKSHSLLFPPSSCSTVSKTADRREIIILPSDTVLDSDEENDDDCSLDGGDIGGGGSGFGPDSALAWPFLEHDDAFAVGGTTAKEEELGHLSATDEEDEAELGLPPDEAASTFVNNRLVEDVPVDGASTSGAVAAASSNTPLGVQNSGVRGLPNDQSGLFFLTLTNLSTRENCGEGADKAGPSFQQNRTDVHGLPHSNQHQNRNRDDYQHRLFPLSSQLSGGRSSGEDGDDFGFVPRAFDRIALPESHPPPLVVPDSIPLGGFSGPSGCFDGRTSFLDARFECSQEVPGHADSLEVQHHQHQQQQEHQQQEQRQWTHGQYGDNGHCEMEEWKGQSDGYGHRQYRDRAREYHQLVTVAELLPSSIGDDIPFPPFV